MRMDLVDEIGRRRPRSPAAAGTLIAIAALVAVALAAAGMAMLAGATSESPGSSATPRPESARIGMRIPTAGLSSFSWSPDGAMLLVADRNGGRVFDRDGRQLATVPAAEGWLDATHLVGWDGVVSDARQSRAGTSPADVRVVASGHGGASVVTGSATCAGDPQVRWYRDGSLGATVERENPLGWSTDGTNVLVGHVACDGGSGQASSTAAGGSTGSPGSGASASAAAPGSWQGDVQVIDFASGNVEGTLPKVAGELAFGVDPGSVAAQSGNDVAILDEGSSVPLTLPGVRFLGWLDVETMFVERSGQILVADLDPPNIPDATSYERWQAAGPKGINLAADVDGNAVAILASDGSTLLDLSSAGLTARNRASADPSTGAADAGPALQPNWWAPDGRTLVLAARDGASLTVISLASATASGSASAGVGQSG